MHASLPLHIHPEPPEILLSSSANLLLECCNCWFAIESDFSETCRSKIHLFECVIRSFFLSFMLSFIFLYSLTICLFFSHTIYTECSLPFLHYFHLSTICLFQINYSRLGLSVILTSFSLTICKKTSPKPYKGCMRQK